MEFDTTEKSRAESSSSFEGSKDSLHFNRQIKIRRKGDTIYYMKNTNYNMQMKMSKENIVQNETEELAMDTVHSSNTESSFKTFSFDGQTNAAEAEKCIAFWKSIMEKNLLPVKTCIITKNAEENMKRAENKIKRELLDDSKEAAKKAARDEYRKLWKGIVKEIQSAKLDDIKMNTRARCQMCNSVENLVKTQSDNKMGIEEEQNVKDLITKKLASTKKKRLPQTDQRRTDKKTDRLISLSEEQERSFHAIGEDETEKTYSEESLLKTSGDEIKCIGEGEMVSDDSVVKTSDDEIKCMAPKSSLMSNAETEAFKSIDTGEFSTRSKITIKRQVSMMLPTGEIELIEKDSQPDLSWKMPVKKKVDHEFGRLRSSVDILIEKKRAEKKSISTSILRGQQEGRNQSYSSTKRTPSDKKSLSFSNLSDRKMETSLDGKLGKKSSVSTSIQSLDVHKNKLHNGSTTRQAKTSSGSYEDEVTVHSKKITENEEGSKNRVMDDGSETIFERGRLSKQSIMSEDRSSEFRTSISNN